MSRTISAGYVYRQYSTEGVYIADYKSSRAAHEATGVSIGSIARAAHGERRTGGPEAVMSGEKYWRIRQRKVLR